jgi:polyisoprenoid-binding protein YceI
MSSQQNILRATLENDTTAPRRLTWLALLLLLAIQPASAALAAPHTLTLDHEATAVGFLLEATGHDVEGQLVLESGTLTLEPMEGSESGAASGQLVLDATRTETGNTRRDRKMHKEVLVSGLHPRIVFTAEGYEGVFPADEGEVKVNGRVELLGMEHALTLTVTYHLDGERFDADVAFDVPFIEWGLEDPSILFLRVDKVVHVHAETAGSWQAPAVDQATNQATEAALGEGH